MLSSKLLFSLLSTGIAISAGIGATVMLNQKDGSVVKQEAKDPFQTTSLTVTKETWNMSSLGKNYTNAESALKAAEEGYETKLKALQKKNEATETESEQNSEAKAAADAEVALGKASQALEVAKEKLALLYLL